MNNRVEREFIGYINEVRILDLQVYRSMCSFIRALEKKYEIDIDYNGIIEDIEMFISDIIEYNTRNRVDIALIDIEEHCINKAIDYLLNRNKIEYNKYDLEHILNRVRNIKIFKERMMKELKPKGE